MVEITGTTIITLAEAKAIAETAAATMMGATITTVDKSTDSE
jgi:hypothetical protein